jgi:hypothetical protein
MWKGATVAAAFLLLGAWAQDTEQNKAQTEEFAKASGGQDKKSADGDDRPEGVSFASYSASSSLRTAAI